MKKLTFIISCLFISTMSSIAQSPITTPDNIASGNCLDFDGNDFVLVNSTLPSVGTVSMWISQSEINLTQPMNMFGSTVGADDRFWIGYRHTDNNLLINLGSGSTDDLGLQNPYLANEWTHLAVTFDYNNDIYRLYVNGINVSTSTVNRDAPTSNTFAIGYNNNAGLIPGQNYFFDGDIDEVRLWNVVRTEQEIRDNMCKTLEGNEAGLIGYWNMNEGNGGVVADLTTNGNDGTLQ